MPSDSFRFSQYRISQVLILVLMECPLTYLGIMIKLGLIVLILVLMECPLTKYHTAISGWYVVLILVLMECPLTNVDGKTCWSLRVLILVLMECPLTLVPTISARKCMSLNPCSNGMPSDITIRNLYVGKDQVLILVLMECPLTIDGERVDPFG